MHGNTRTYVRHNLLGIRMPAIVAPLLLCVIGFSSCTRQGEKAGHTDVNGYEVIIVGAGAGGLGAGATLPFCSSWVRSTLSR